MQVGRERARIGWNRSARRPILWYNTRWTDRFKGEDMNSLDKIIGFFYEQNNLSAFKKMFLEQVEFAMKEHF